VEQFKENRLMCQLYLKAFKGNYHEMANVISKLRSYNKHIGGEGSDGSFHINDLDKYLAMLERKQIPR
jgi:hypothetical protein